MSVSVFVCLSVTMCIVALKVSVRTELKVVSSCSQQGLPIHFFGHFLECILATNGEQADGHQKQKLYIAKYSC